MLLALIVLFLASLAAALIGLSIRLDQRAQIEALERVHGRMLLDAGLADALARRRANPRFRGRGEDLAAGSFASSIRTISPFRFVVTVEAASRERQRRIRCDVRVRPDGSFRVTSCDPVPATDLAARSP